MANCWNNLFSLLLCLSCCIYLSAAQNQRPGTGFNQGTGQNQRPGTGFNQGTGQNQRPGAGELQIITEHKPPNCLETADTGDLVTLHYTGRLADGTIFDSSRQQGQPFQFKLGAGQVIKGWDQGIKGMCVGERRRLVIPPHLAYGRTGTGPIPADATLTFQTELVALQKQPNGGVAKNSMLPALSLLAVLVGMVLFVE